MPTSLFRSPSIFSPTDPHPRLPSMSTHLATSPASIVFLFSYSFPSAWTQPHSMHVGWVRMKGEGWEVNDHSIITPQALRKRQAYLMGDSRHCPRSRLCVLVGVLMLLCLRCRWWKRKEVKDQNYFPIPRHAALSVIAFHAHSSNTTPTPTISRYTGAYLCHCPGQGCVKSQHPQQQRVQKPARPRRRFAPCPARCREMPSLAHEAPPSTAPSMPCLSK